MGVVNCCKEGQNEEEIYYDNAKFHHIINKNYNQNDDENFFENNKNGNKIDDEIELDNDKFNVEDSNSIPNNENTKIKMSNKQRNISIIDNINEQIVEKSRIVKEENMKNDISPKILRLIILESKSLPVNSILIINSLGLEGSLRNGQDGIVVFGKSKPYSNNIDFLLQKEEGINDRHFEIKYDDISDNYFLRNVKKSGVFIKIDNEIEIRDNMIISFGINHILMSIIDYDLKSVIKFKIIYGPNKDEER